MPSSISHSENNKLVSSYPLVSFPLNIKKITEIIYFVILIKKSARFVAWYVTRSKSAGWGGGGPHMLIKTQIARITLYAS